MVLLLIFSVSVQRPQCYSQMYTPTPTERSDMKEIVTLRDLFQLQTAIEKAQRCLDMPNFIVPDFILKYVRFHTKKMRNILMEGTCKDEQAGDDMPLIMRTETRQALSTPQVTNKLERYLKCAMPEAQNVARMSIGSTYCTMFMQEYRKRSLHP